MANINLYQDDQSEKVAKPKMIDTGLIVGIVIFLLVLAAYGGLEFYLRSLDKKIEASKAEEVSGKNMLDGKDVDLAVSFQQRMDILEAEKTVFSKNSPNSIFSEVQKSMVSGAVASAIGFEGKILRVTFAADDFEILAQQIMSFKNNGAFTNVEVNRSSRDEGGKVSAELNMTVAF